MRCRSHIRDREHYEAKQLYECGPQRPSDCNESRSCPWVLVSPSSASLATAGAVAGVAKRATGAMASTKIRTIGKFVRSQLLEVMVQQANGVSRRDAKWRISPLVTRKDAISLKEMDFLISVVEEAVYMHSAW